MHEIEMKSASAVHHKNSGISIVFSIMRCTLSNSSFKINMAFFSERKKKKRERKREEQDLFSLWRLSHPLLQQLIRNLLTIP
jgi:hypothetical protein